MTSTATRPSTGIAIRRLRKTLRRGPKLLIGAAFVLASLFPLAWLAISGFKHRTEVVRSPFQFFPDIWIFENYQNLFADAAFMRSLTISFLGATAFTLLSLSINSLAGYAFARLSFPFKRTLWVYVIATMLVPGMAILVTAFIVVAQLGMLDSLLVLLLPPAASGLHIFFTRQFYLNIPVSLEEAALLDGCNRTQIYRHIFLPMSLPALVVVGITSFLTYWNAYVWPIMTITDPNLFQIQQYLASYRSGRFPDLGMLMAGSMLAALPVIILFLTFQRYIMAGVRITGMK